MMKELFILSIIFGLFSCKGVNTSTEEVAQNHINSDRDLEILFTDIIPEHLSDSLKVDIMNHLVSNIDTDSSLITKEAADSAGIPVIGFFKNDSLLKILIGNYTSNRPDAIFGSYDYTTFYFLMDTLIYSKHECKHASLRTGSCNSVYLSIESYYYNGRKISEIVDDQIGDYWSCGCGMSPKVMTQIDKKSRESINYGYIEELKELINTANKP